MLEYFSPTEYKQLPELNFEQAKGALNFLAGFHAFFWRLSAEAPCKSQYTIFVLIKVQYLVWKRKSFHSVDGGEELCDQQSTSRRSLQYSKEYAIPSLV